MSTTTQASKAESVIRKEIIISADSHIIEPTNLWQTRLPASFKDRAPKIPPRNSPGEKPGGYDPKARLQEMAVDGVAPSRAEAVLRTRMTEAASAPSSTTILRASRRPSSMLTGAVWW